MENHYSQLKLFASSSIFIIWSSKISSAVAAPTDIDSEATSTAFWNSSHALPVGLLMVLASLVILSLALMACMDCMNSEVSSESHPASMSSAPKWGGATNYHRAGEGEGGTDSCFVSEVINPSDLRNVPLPYSMVPTQIPDAAEFRGYQTSGASSGMAGYNAVTPSAPLNEAGYNSNPGQAGYATNSGGGNRGRHYNPADIDDLPPPYSEANRN